MFDNIRALPWNLIAWVWAYNLAWMMVQNVVKLGIYRELNSRAANRTPFLKHLKALCTPMARCINQTDNPGFIRINLQPDPAAQATQRE